METVRTYLLGVIAAAIVCGIVTRILGDKGTQGAMAKLIAGLFLAFTVIRPVADLSIGSVADLTDQYSAAGADAAAEGERMTREALALSIKSQTEAYILDKAEALNVTLTVEVTLSEEDIPTPASVCLTGKVSPYAKQRLQTVIADDIGIDKEHQTWI